MSARERGAMGEAGRRSRGRSIEAVSSGIGSGNKSMAVAAVIGVISISRSGGECNWSDGGGGGGEAGARI